MGNEQFVTKLSRSSSNSSFVHDDDLKITNDHNKLKNNTNSKNYSNNNNNNDKLLIKKIDLSKRHSNIMNRNYSTKINSSKKDSFEYNAEVYKLNSNSNCMQLLYPELLRLIFSTYYTNNPNTIYFTLNIFKLNFEKLANCTLIYPGTKIYFETKLQCRFTDLNNNIWSIKFQNINEAESFQKNIRATIKDFYGHHTSRTSSTNIKNQPKNRLSLSLLSDLKNRKYKYTTEDKSEFYLNTIATSIDDNNNKNKSLMNTSKENESPIVSSQKVASKSELSIHNIPQSTRATTDIDIQQKSIGLLIPRSHSDMNIVKNFINDNQNSKTPSLNSILDNEGGEKIKSKKLIKQNSEPESDYPDSNSHNSLKLPINTNYRNSEYTDSGIGYGSLIDTNSHRSSLLSQISSDSGYQQAQNSLQTQQTNNHVNYLNANLIQDLNNRTNAKWLKKQKQKKEVLNRKMITSIAGLLNLDDIGIHPKQQQQQEKQAENCIFTDLNLLISDDELINDKDDELATQSSSCGDTSNKEEKSSEPKTSEQNLDIFQSIRKAGWLNFKNWLVNSRGKLELASKRSWKKYWVTLRNTTLYFYGDSSESDDNLKAKLTIDFQNCVVQSLPEYPRKENIFCLSTSFGQVFLFQTYTQNELENWMRIINNSCAYSFAQTTKKQQVLQALSVEYDLIEKNIDKESKMKKMAELHLNVTQDSKSKEAIVKQIMQWDKNLEKLNVNLYRNKCYYASINSTEIPNPKTLLAQASKSSKTLLTKLGAFTVCTLHAFNMQPRPKVTQSNNDLFSLKSTQLNTICTPRNQNGNHIEFKRNSKFGSSMRVVSTELKKDFLFDNDMQSLNNNINRIINILLPNKEYMKIDTKDYIFTKQLLDAVCLKMRLESKDYFFINVDNRSTKIDLNDRINDQLYNNLELHKKQLYSVQFSLVTFENLGLNIEAELDDTDDTCERDDKVRVFVSSINENCEASRRGILVGDEILIINGQLIENLDLDRVNKIMREYKELRLTLKTSRTLNEMEFFNLACSNSPSKQQQTLLTSSHTVPKSADQLAQTEAIINQMICPPPPPSCLSYKMNLKSIDSLIVPAPQEYLNENLDESFRSQNKLKRQNAKIYLNDVDTAVDSINNLLKEVEQVTNICRSNEVEILDDPARIKPLTNAQKLRKVIFELLDTEKNYVKDLECMIERYLEPLKQESFLSQDDIDCLFGNIQEILEFQKIFLQSLEQSIDVNILTYNSIAQFRNALFSIGGSFLYYSNHFKVYGSFCANHSKAQKQLKPENNPKLEQFLIARNPKQQHSSSLESYLIKPIQRILKYPLLLKQLLNYADSNSEEFQHLNDALKCMQSVAEQINDMQKIFEEYGVYFDTVMKKYKNDRYVKIDLSPNHLLLYGQVDWLNISDEIEKINKKHTYETLCFIFDSGALLLCIESKSKSTTKKAKDLQKPKQNACFLTFIPLMELQVRNYPNEQNTSGMFTWDLIHMHTSIGGSPAKIYTLANRCQETKMIFVKRIRSLIQESVRDISFKTVISPSPQIRVITRIKGESSNKQMSYFNRYSCIIDHSELAAAKYSPSSWTENSSSQPDSPIWKPRNFTSATTTTNTDNSSETTASDTSESKRKHRYIQYKVPKSPQFYDDPEVPSNLRNYFYMNSNNDSTEC